MANESLKCQLCRAPREGTAQAALVQLCLLKEPDFRKEKINLCCLPLFKSTMFTSLHPPTRVYRGCRTSPHFTATSLVWEFYWSVSFGGILVGLFHYLKS